MSEILIEVLRGTVVESIHRGDIAVVDCDNRVLHRYGDIEHPTFMRSSSKPLQAIAALEYGIVGKFGLNLSEIAVLMSSHSGEKIHIDTLMGIIKKIGIGVDDLQCGIHEPLGIDAAKELLSKGLAPNSLHCNCSGKHLGQIAAAKVKGTPLEDYYKLGGGIQPEIQDILAKFSGVDTAQIKLGIDGCGLPVYCLPLRNLALAYANLCSGNFMDGRYLESQNHVIRAMTVHPEMIGGKGRFDTELMTHFGDRLIGKFGDEGVYCVGLIGKGIGIALKIEDGHTRAVSPTVLETLKQLEIIKIEEMALLRNFWNPSIKNHRGEVVGEIRTAFKL